MTTNQTFLQPAYILHYYPYRDTSVIATFLTTDYGKISAVVRGVRSARSSYKGLIQPFIPLLISWSGKTDLVTIKQIEQQGVPKILQGQNLLSGFYLNELLVRLLQRNDPHPQVFNLYNLTIAELQQPKNLQKTLRLFEKKLLEELGYGLPLDYDANTGAKLNANSYYYFDPAQGAILLPTNPKQGVSGQIFQGQSLISLRDEDLSDRNVLRDAKRLMRLALGLLLGGKPLHSRDLFEYKG